MAQFARPDSDVTVTSFTNGFAAIDEATASDADFAYGANNTAAVLQVGLSNVTDPSASSGHIFRYRIAKTNAGAIDGTGNAVTVTVRLMQGTTQIATDTAKTATGTWTQYAYTLAPAEAAAITDYTDLRLEFTASASGGSPANRRGGAVSWAELEVPAVAAPSGTGAITVPAATVAGSGSLILTGTGAVTLPAATVAGSGSEILTGTGAITTPAATVAGSGAEVFTATGAVSLPAATVAGTGDHTEAAPPAPSGTGAISLTAVTVAGSGALTFTGTGAIALPAATVSGSGSEILTATGAISMPAPTVAGAGAEAFTGSGSFITVAPAVSGSGSHAASGGSHTATGALTAPVVLVAGVGNLSLSGNTAPAPGIAYDLSP